MSLKRYIVVFLGVILPAVWTNMQAQQANCSYLIWNDEFDYSGAPATAKWDYDTGSDGWGNNELQTYTNSRTNSWVENGKLYIKAIKSNGSWSSARLVTRQKGDWLNGRIEVKAKLPSGKGTWPAIWMLPTDWEYGAWPKSGEIDIMEHVGYDPGVVHGTAHTEAYNHSIGTQKGASKTIADATSVAHVYVIEWSQEQIKWYVDDQLYFTFNNEKKTYKEWPFDKRFHLLLNIAIGGNWGGAQGIDSNLTEATMEIEYVRVYQNLLSKPVIAGPKTAKSGDEIIFSVKTQENISYEWILPEGVTIVSGQGTSEIKVKWGAASGNVQVKLTSACETILSDVFAVSVTIVPTGSSFIIPFFDTNGTILWTTQPGTGNSISLSGNSSLVVNYLVNEPISNPFIEYEFDGLVDFSQYTEMSLQVKTNPADLPSIVRIDLIDSQGNVNLNDLFKITSFTNPGQFQVYTYQFGKNPNAIYRLNEIRKVRIYINYGVFGKKSNSSIELKDLSMSVLGTTALSATLSNANIRFFPNPFKDVIYFSAIDTSTEVIVFNLLGKVVIRKKLNGSSFLRLNENLPTGIYVIQLTDKTGYISNHRLIKR